MTVTSRPPADAQPRADAAEAAAVARRICPFLLGDDGGWRSVVATRDQRCGALEPPAALALDKQRRLCLSADHVTCATYGAAIGHAIAIDGATAQAVMPGVTRWALTRTSPVVLDQGRMASVATLARRRTGPQIALVGVMAVALAAVVVARLPPSGAAPLLAGAAGSASLLASATPTPATASPTPRRTPAPTPSAVASARPTTGPSASPSVRPSASASPTPAVTAAPRTYRVREGDTLYDLAIRFHTTVRAIQAANGMGSSTTLRTGQVIRLP